MEWLSSAFKESSILWLLLTTTAALLSGFASSWLTFRFVKRRELQYAEHMKTEREREDRIRSEVIRWSNPILSSVQELEDRLENILSKDGYLALSKDYELHVNPNWSISYDYFMSSVLFAFGQYFAWTHMLQEELSFELFESHLEKDEFMTRIGGVDKALAGFPPKYLCSGRDTQVFSLQQRAIGELFISRGEQCRCISFPEFARLKDTDDFSQHLKPLQALLEEVSPESDCRWKRLTATRQALGELAAQCRSLLALPNDT